MEGPLPPTGDQATSFRNQDYSSIPQVPVFDDNLEQPQPGTEGGPQHAGPLKRESAFNNSVSECDDSSKPNSLQGKRKTAPLEWGWWWETAGVVVSVICIMLIIVILWSMHGKALSAWKLPIKPNSLIAVISTIARSALLMPLAECISQLKWVYFSSARSLSQLQAFDDASRGPFGSFMFLWKTKFTAVTAGVAAFVTIIALAFEPTAQQVIDYPTRNAPLQNTTSSIAVASGFYMIPSEGPESLSAFVDANSLISSVFTTKAASERPSIECPTTDCRWPRLTTFGFCSSCRNYTIAASDSLACNYTIYLDGIDFTAKRFHNFSSLSDFYISNKDQVDFSTMVAYCKYQDLDLSYTGDPNLPTFPAVNFTLEDVGDPHLTINTKFWEHDTWFTLTALRSTSDQSQVWGANVTASVSVCEMKYCVQHLDNVVFRDGKHTADVTTKDVVVTSREEDYYGPPNADGHEGSIRDVLYGTVYTEYSDGGNTSTSTKYGVRRTTTDGLQVYLEPFLNFNYTPMDISPMTFPGSPISRAIADVYLYDHPAQDVMAGIANVLNAMMRSAVNYNSTAVSGEAYVPETYINVHWQWLSFPIFVVLSTASLLVTTILHNAKSSKPLLKSSVIAFLFHGLEGWEEEDLVLDSDTKETSVLLAKKAGPMRAMLVRNEDGNLKFVRAD